MCHPADKNRVSWVTDSRVVVQHANGSWSFQTGRQWGGPLRPAVTAGRRGGGAVHAEGGQDVLKRPRHHCMQARANEFGPILCVSMRMKRVRSSHDGASGGIARCAAWC